MPAYLSPIGNEPQIDASGDPLVGGKLYTYLAGTSTAQDAYTSSSGLVPQANPIILNARGAPDNPIWLQGSTSYKLILKDSADVTLNTWDNVTGINDPSLTSVQDEWVLFTGDPTYISATSFSVPGDQTGIFTVGRRLKSSNTAGTIYSTITASAFGAGITTVTVVNDSGTLDSGLSAVSYGLLNSQNRSTPLGGPVTIQTFTASGTWTRPANCRAIVVEVQGGGGGGGGAGGGGSGTAAGAGGGGGGYSCKLIVNPAASESVTVGAGGTAGADTGGSGGTGGTSSFGAHCSATGGVGGNGSATRSTTVSRGAGLGGAPGTGSSGDFNLAGGGGLMGACFNTLASSGGGGASHLGCGGRPGTEGSTGTAGSIYGGGGSGGCSDSATGRVGGIGGAGIVIVREFY